MASDSQSRKWQITINNPVDKGFTHDRLKELLSGMKSVIYWCMADEIGEEGTHHTHLYLQGRGGINFSTIKNALTVDTLRWQKVRLHKIATT